MMRSQCAAFGPVFGLRFAAPASSRGRWRPPASERSQHGTGTEFVPPRTPLEEAVAQVWRDALKVDLPLQTLFASPSLGKLAARIGALAELNDLSEDEIRALVEQEALENEELE